MLKTKIGPLKSHDQIYWKSPPLKLNIYTYLYSFELKSKREYVIKQVLKL